MRLNKRSFESPLQKEVVAFLREALIPPAFVAANFAGNQLSKWARFHGARSGFHSGMPDLTIYAPGPKILGIELKGRTKYLSKSQKRVQESFRELGMRYVRCSTLNAVLAALKEYEIPISQEPSTQVTVFRAPINIALN